MTSGAVATAPKPCTLPVTEPASTPALPGGQLTVGVVAQLVLAAVCRLGPPAQPATATDAMASITRGAIRQQFCSFLAIPSPTQAAYCR
jgi:hypothetical protein